METTTDLSKITFGYDSNFTWGRAMRRHDIGEYTIIEYHPHLYKNHTSTGEIDSTTTMFSCYIDNRHMGRSAESLDAALVHCIAHKHDGLNTHADRYFMKMIAS